jgi:outer membrane protein assembly factor BamB
MAWTISGLGQGYGSPSIADDAIYVQGTQKGKSVVHALKRSDGTIFWVRPLGAALPAENGGGPRGTPTVDGDRVYALSEAGDLACLSAQDGTILWSRNILKDFSARNLQWLISESPLVDGNHVVVSPGGTRAGIVALDKMTGRTVWTCTELSDPAAYSSCVVAEVHGLRVITNLTSKAAVGVSAADGKLLWRYGPVANATANITTPVFNGNRVFYTSGYDTGCALLEFTTGSGGMSIRDVYFSRSMVNHHGGVVLIGGHVYGFSNSTLTCVNLDTGKTVWKHRSVGKGSLTYADGHLYLLSEDDTVGLAEAKPAGYVEKGRFKIKDEGYSSWTHPVVCGARLYIRNQSTLAVYNLSPE